MSVASPDPYDALLVLSFGGPEGPDDVLPFLRRVTAGKDIPEERLAEVARHYDRFGGRSPINDQVRDLLRVVRDDLAAAGVELPVFWGNRNWHPFLVDTVREMTALGVRRAACFVTSAYSSYSGCRQYRENLAEAQAAVPGAPDIDVLPAYWDRPGFVQPFVDAVQAALATLPPDQAAAARLVFVTHSLPTAMAATSGPEGGAYPRQHRQVLEDVTTAVAGRTGVRHQADLAYCSRSGPPQVPWLEPDVGEVLRAEAAADGRAVVLVPIGFVSDHLEVRYDLDTEAAEVAAELKLPFRRAATPGTDPRFAALPRELLLEQAARVRTGLPAPGCPPHCCPRPSHRKARP